MSKTSIFFKYFLLFSIPILIISILPGPTFVAGFLLIYSVFLFTEYKNLSLAFFHVYLITLIMGRPLVTLEGVLFQDYVYFKSPVMLSLPISIPYRFVFFLFFLVSLITINAKRFQKKRVSRQNILPVAILFFMALWVSLGQIFGDYFIRYKFPFLQSVQILMVFPVVYFFLKKYAHEKDILSRAQLLLWVFIFVSLCIEGLTSALQYLIKSPININIEGIFTAASVSAPENNMFRSPGTLNHPNYLGVFSGMLLLPALYSLIFNKERENRKKVVAGISVILGIISLVLSLSRWAWISFFVGAVILFISGKKKLLKLKNKFSNLGLIYKLIVVSVLFVIIFLITVRFGQISTLEGRVEIFKIAISQTFRHPFFGLGPINSTVSLVPYRQNIESYIYSLKGVHSTPVLIAVENGIPALILFVAFLVYIFFVSLKHWKKIKESYLISFFLIIVVFLLNSLAYSLLYWDASFELFFLFSAFYLYGISQLNSSY